MRVTPILLPFKSAGSLISGFVMTEKISVSPVLAMNTRSDPLNAEFTTGTEGP
jgi:hypothetical protein